MPCVPRCSCLPVGDQVQVQVANADVGVGVIRIRHRRDAFPESYVDLQLVVKRQDRTLHRALGHPGRVTQRRSVAPGSPSKRTHPPRARAEMRRILTPPSCGWAPNSTCGIRMLQRHEALDSHPDAHAAGSDAQAQTSGDRDRHPVRAVINLVAQLMGNLFRARARAWRSDRSAIWQRTRLSQRCRGNIDEALPRAHFPNPPAGAPLAAARRRQPHRQRAEHACHVTQGPGACDAAPAASGPARPRSRRSPIRPGWTSLARVRRRGAGSGARPWPREPHAAHACWHSSSLRRAIGSSAGSSGCSSIVRSRCSSIVAASSAVVSELGSSGAKSGSSGSEASSVAHPTSPRPAR